MSNIIQSASAKIDTLRMQKTGILRTFPLRDDDCQQLQRHLKQPDIAQRPFLDHVLRHKITASRPTRGEVPKDVVTGASCVSYALDGGPAQIGFLSHRATNGAHSGVIPVCSLLGATLIGMRVGERAPLLHEDGAISSLTVLSVAPTA